MVVFYPMAGEHIEDAAKSACRTATNNFEVIELRFNHFKINVKPFDNPVEIVKKYMAKIALDNYQCENNPERLRILEQINALPTYLEKIDFVLSMLPTDKVTPDEFEDLLKPEEHKRQFDYWLNHLLWLKFNNHGYPIGHEDYLSVKEAILGLYLYRPWP